MKNWEAMLIVMHEEPDSALSATYVAHRVRQKQWGKLTGEKPWTRVTQNFHRFPQFFELNQKSGREHCYCIADRELADAAVSRIKRENPHLFEQPKLVDDPVEPVKDTLPSETVAASSETASEPAKPLSATVDPFSIPIVFLRVGWMDRYRGLRRGDSITGGGKFVEEHGYGHEICNFEEQEGRFYGYARPPRGASDMSSHPRINIGRLGASNQDETVSGVLAIWVANHPETHEPVIVGWYWNATVFRNFQPSLPDADRTHNGEELGFYITASSSDSVLLPKDERLFSIPSRGKGKMGQSNIWYADDRARHGKLRRQVLKYVANRKLPRATKQRGTGKRKQPDPLIRQKVEKAAVAVTTKHFKSMGYEVDSFEKDNVGWDLEADRDKIKLRLEVKGLSGSEVCVELTPNEYAKMTEYEQSYRICVVTNALSNPRLDVFAFSTDSQRWEDQDGRPMTFEEIVAARCRVE